MIIVKGIKKFCKLEYIWWGMNLIFKITNKYFYIYLYIYIWISVTICTVYSICLSPFMQAGPWVEKRKKIFFHLYLIRERSSIMSARLGGVGGLIKNADTADAGEGSLMKCWHCWYWVVEGWKSHGLEQKSRENQSF